VYRQWVIAKPGSAQRVSYRRMLRAGQIEERELFDEVVRWKLSELTRVATLLDAPKVRAQLVTDLEIAGRADATAAHDRMIELALAHLPELIKDPSYHLGTRYNALLLLGDLNDVERRRFHPPTPPKPCAAALPLLLDWLEQPAEHGETSRDALLLAALVGITRHAQLGIGDEAQRLRAVQGLAKLAAEVQPPVHRSTDGHHWLRRRAVRALAYVVAPGRSADDAPAAQAVFAILDERDAPLSLAFEAAGAWGAIAARMPAGEFDPLATLEKFAGLCQRAIQEELIDSSHPDRGLARESSARVLATRLAIMAKSCEVLRRDESTKGSATAPLATLEDLYERCRAWIKLVADPETSPRQAGRALSRALADLEFHRPPP
jgi:hypothetical protein